MVICITFYWHFRNLLDYWTIRSTGQNLKQYSGYNCGPYPMVDNWLCITQGIYGRVVFEACGLLSVHVYDWVSSAPTLCFGEPWIVFTPPSQQQGAYTSTLVHHFGNGHSKMGLEMPNFYIPTHTHTHLYVRIWSAVLVKENNKNDLKSL